MDIVEKLRELSALEKSFPMSGTCWYEKAADEIEQLREYIKNWKDTDSAAIMALSQAQREIEKLRGDIKKFEVIVQKLLVNQTTDQIVKNLFEHGTFTKPTGEE